MGTLFFPWLRSGDEGILFPDKVEIEEKGKRQSPQTIRFR